jgi:lauroyl/myristoyl acyltransferase
LLLRHDLQQDFIDDSDGLPMNLISFLSTRMAPVLGLLIVKILNQEQSYRFADWVARRLVSQRDSSMIRAVRSNQAVIRGLPFDAPELDDAVYEVIRNAARGYADWYRATHGGPEAVKASIDIDPQLVEYFNQAQIEKRGLMIVGAHMSSFNIMLLALGAFGYPIQALSYANVQGGVHVDNAVRRRFGLNLTPISPKSLKEAIRRLNNGGLVMTAADRPDVGGDELVFFGRKAILPIGPARLAVATGSRVLVGMIQTMGSNKYRAVATPPIEPVITGDRERDVLHLAQRYINLIEDYIRERPGEWLMFLPIWPDEVPPLTVS